MGFDWRGWCGPEPPFHAPMFVLTHYLRDPLAMAGGTRLEFVATASSTTSRRVTHVSYRILT